MDALDRRKPIERHPESLRTVNLGNQAGIRKGGLIPNRKLPPGLLAERLIDPKPPLNEIPGPRLLFLRLTRVSPQNRRVMKGLNARIDQLSQRKNPGSRDRVSPKKARPIRMGFLKKQQNRKALGQVNRRISRNFKNGNRACGIPGQVFCALGFSTQKAYRHRFIGNPFEIERKSNPPGT